MFASLQAKVIAGALAASVLFSGLLYIRAQRAENRLLTVTVSKQAETIQTLQDQIKIAQITAHDRISGKDATIVRIRRICGRPMPPPAAQTEGGRPSNEKVPAADDDSTGALLSGMWSVR